jgi:formylglycine-generating enzyme required for sulfatase activity
MNTSKKLNIVFWGKGILPKFFLAVLFAFCFSAIVVGSTSIEDLNLAQTKARKIALVIGNTEYASNPLSNPVNDAQLIADSLKKIGFQVVIKKDLTKEQMVLAFDQFAREIKSGDVVFFYYAGHGLQIGGKNFLIPTDYISDSIDSFWDVGQAMDEISSKSGLNIIVLDACRNTSSNLLKLPNVGIGFTEFKTTAGGNYVAFSTAPGDTASDGLPGEKNSPYAAALAESLLMQPARLEDVFIRTQIEVERVTAVSSKQPDKQLKTGSRAELAGGGGKVVGSRGHQVPWTSSSLKQVFYFTVDRIAESPLPKPIFVGSLHPKLTGGLLGGLRQFSFKTPMLNERGTVVQQKPGQAKVFFEPLKLSKIEMAQVTGGRFLMGASAAEVSVALKEAKLAAENGILEDESYEVLSAEMPRHAVNVNGFYMSRFEITQAQYLAVMGKLPNIEPSFYGAEMPVINVTWQEANDFCSKLSQLTGRSYRLPTEAEWEYAARAGTNTPFAFGETLNPQVAVYNSAIPYGKALRGARRSALMPVGEITSPNAFGLQDMSGNVWEWVADYWHSSYDGAPQNGAVWDEPEILFDEEENEEVEDKSRVVRGGSWFSPAGSCRSASRFRFFPATRAKNVGFRVVAQ